MCSSGRWAASPQLLIANQIAAFNTAVIYLKLHKAESTLIGRDSFAFGNIRTPPPPKYSNKFLFILFVDLFLERLKNIG